MQVLATNLEGKLVGGEYLILRQLASGGSGTVYLAEQRSTQRQRALKVLHGWLVRDAKIRARFLEEARVSSAIDSDHVVEVIGAGIDAETELPWIAMELLRGKTLQSHVESRGPIGKEELLELFVQARHALQKAHERPLVHRDLKPENIFIAEARRRGVPFTVKVLDFGIAKWLHDAHNADRNSQIIGSPLWMAPEQLHTGAEITPATDVWALGLIAFWALTGRAYWRAANAQEISVGAVLAELLTEPLQPASERAARLGASRGVPPKFDAWFAKCVDRDPSKRFQDAGSCVDALEEALLSSSDVMVGGTHSRVQAVNVEPTILAALERNAHDANALQRLFELRKGQGDATGALWAARVAQVMLPEEQVPAELRDVAEPPPLGTQRPLPVGSLGSVLWAGAPSLFSLTPLAMLLAEPLRKSGAQPTPDGEELPAAVQQLSRRAASALHLTPPTLVGLREEPLLRAVNPTPWTFVLGAPFFAARLEGAARYLFIEQLARISEPISSGTWPGSPEAMELCRKAAAVFVRGAPSSNPYWRAVVATLGARREQLARALTAAEDVSFDLWCRAAQATAARAALVLTGNLHDARAGFFEHPERGLDAPEERLRALSLFALTPGFTSLWRTCGATLSH